MSNIVIIGGGAAGLLAAGTAVRLGKKVTIVEKNHRPARKVIITGKGRCNLTNASTQQELLDSVVTNPRFLYSAFSGFSPYDVMDLFQKQLHIPLKIERGNRVFPVSDRAVDIVDGLAKFADGATMICDATCTEILFENKRVIGIRLLDGRKIDASSVIIASGGCSYPATGSTGDGYTLASQAGHRITPLLPSLVPVVCHSTDCREMMGLSLKNVTVSVVDTATNQCIYNELGEMLFTHFGLSGPLILSASAHMRPMENGRYIVSIDLKPGLSAEQLDARILRDFQENIHRTLRNSLGKLLPAKMIPVLIKRTGISPETKVNQITREQRLILINTIKEFSFKVNGFRPIDEAIVTCGGVDVKEINPKTMESKLIKGLFFAGEVIDVDAYTGGYNLQIAFSTGYLAGNYAE